jgi:hypothetical protein
MFMPTFKFSGRQCFEIGDATAFLNYWRSHIIWMLMYSLNKWVYNGIINRPSMTNQYFSNLLFTIPIYTCHTGRTK